MTSAGQPASPAVNVAIDCPFDDIDLAILRTFADGGSIKRAAAVLAVTRHVVEWRLVRMRGTTGTHTITHLIATAIRRGWIK